MLKALYHARRNELESAVESAKNLHSLMSLIEEGKSNPSKCKYCYNIGKGTKFYRLRSDKENLKAKEDFLHVPFDELHKCSSMRFSLSGMPFLYLGYTEAVCRAELKKESGGSVGCFEATRDIRVIDLTMTSQYGNSLFYLWPILAACYVAPDVEASYKEEYLFPQILMSLINKKYFEKQNGEDKIMGIRYYSCRKPDLDVMSDDYKNVALFTNPPLGENASEFDIEKGFPSSYRCMYRYDNVLKEILKFIPLN